MFREGEKIEARVFQAEAKITLGRTLSLGKSRVPMGLAPIDPEGWIFADPDGIARASTLPSAERIANR